MVRGITETDLRSVNAGESQAHVRYSAYSKRAKAKGYANIARLFSAIAFAGSVHAGNNYRNEGSKGDAVSVSKAMFCNGSTFEDI